MTAVLSYVSKEFSIILSDNRINFGRYQEHGFEDGHVKLVNLRDMGWASGAGLSDYLFKLKEALASNEIKDTNNIEILFKSVLEACKSENPIFEEDIDASVVVASWLGANETSIFLRVGILSNKHFGTNLAILENGSINIVYPGDFLESPNKIKFTEERYDLNIGKKGFWGSLRIMLNIFNDISLNSKQVSRTCDIGIHIIQEDGIYKFKISGEIETLLSELNTGSIQDRIEIINSITKN